MKALVELLALLIVAGLVWLLVARTLMTRRERIELHNLRSFKDEVRDASLNELEIEPASNLARIILGHVHEVDKANSSTTRKAIS